MIEIKNLVKRYGRIKAVNDISFSVNAGEIVGFLGPNGAGKSTTMNIITGYIPSTSGVVKVGGYDVMEEPDKVKRMIGYLPEIPPLYADMTVNEYLSFVSELKKVPKKSRKSQMDEITGMMNIADHGSRLIKNLSKGYKQRVGFAQALLGEPELIILDEPTIGLDPRQIIEIRNLIKELGKKHTIILSSHILQEVSAVCERVIIINKGRIVAVDTPENLSKNMGSATRLSVTVAGDPQEVLPAISDIDGVKSANIANEREDGVFGYVIESDKEVDIRRQLFFTLSDIGCPILELRSLDFSLEEIFLELVANEQSHPDDADENGTDEDNSGEGGGGRKGDGEGGSNGGGSEGEGGYESGGEGGEGDANSEAADAGQINEAAHTQGYNKEADTVDFFEKAAANERERE